MDLIMDFLLLAASASACLYCWVLNRKLKALTNARAGLGASIVALSRSAEEMRAAVEGTKSSAGEAAARLEVLLKEAEARAADLRLLNDEVEAVGKSVVDHAGGAAKKYLSILSPFMTEANAAADRLLHAVSTASPAADAEVASAKKSTRLRKAMPRRAAA